MDFNDGADSEGSALLPMNALNRATLKRYIGALVAEVGSPNESCAGLAQIVGPALGH